MTITERIRTTLQSNWFYFFLFAFLIVLPHLIGWITDEGPFGVIVRERRRFGGASIFWQGILIEVFILVILTLSYNLMFGFSGVISFGHALFFGLGGYTLGVITEKSGIASPDAALVVGFVLAILLAGVIGFLVGLASLRLRGVYFAIFTLGVAEMAYIWVARWAFTNAEDGLALSNMPELFNPTRNRLFIYYLTLGAVIFTFLFIRRVMNSPTGRVLLAVRENEDRARMIGYNTLAYKLMAISVASMLAAGAGILYAIFNDKVGPEMMSVNFTIDPLLMTIIGGVGTFTGPVVGAAGLTLTERIFDREFIIAGTTINLGEHWSLILGLIFIFVVMIFPQGIVGTINRWRAERKARTAPPQRGEVQPSPAGD